MRVLSLEFEKAEGGLGVEPASDDSPEKEFDRRWALTLLDRVMARLAVDATDKGKGEQFEALKPYLTGDEPQLSYAATASALTMSDAAVKVAVHRLRKKFRDFPRRDRADGRIAGRDRGRTVHGV